jgi:hypothetical protein
MFYLKIRLIIVAVNLKKIHPISQNIFTTVSPLLLKVTISYIQQS